MTVSRRQLLSAGISATAIWPLISHAQTALPEGWRVFKSPLTDGEKKLLSTDNKPQYVLAAVEPLSWAAIAAWIIEKAGEAVISAVVGAVISAVLGGEKVDLDKVIRRSFADFLRRLLEALDQRDIDKAMAVFRSTHNLMTDYARDPQSRRGMIEHLIVQSSNNVEEFRRLRVPATAGLALASALDIAINLEKFSLSKSSGNWAAVRARIDQYRTSVDSNRKELIERTNARLIGPEQILFDERTRTCFEDVPGRDTRRPVPCQTYRWGYRIDGEFVPAPPGAGEGTALEAMAQARDGLIRDQLEKIIVPAEGVAQVMEQRIPVQPPK